MTSEKMEIALAERSPDPLPVGDEKQAGLVADLVHASEAEYTPAQYRRLVRKVDWIILPLMWIISGTQYADKASISTQATFGLEQDTHLVSQQYSWLTSIFYLAFLVSEAPGNYILQRVSVGPTVAVSMFFWGKAVQQYLERARSTDETPQASSCCASPSPPTLRV